MEFTQTNDSISTKPISKGFQFCSDCGARLLDVAKFCDQCGTKVDTPKPFADSTNSDPLVSFETGKRDEQESQAIPQGSHAQMETNLGTDFDPFAAAGIKDPAPESPSDEGNIAVNLEAITMNEEEYVVEHSEVPGEFTVVIKPGESGLRVSKDSAGECIVVSQPPRRQMVLLDKASLAATAEAPMVLPDVGHLVLSINGQPCQEEAIDTVRNTILKRAQEGSKPFTLKFKVPETQDTYLDLFDSNVDEEEAAALSKIHRTKGLYYDPPDHIDMVYGYVERFRGEKMTTFHLYRESDNKFILAASVEAQGRGKIIFHNLQDIQYEGSIEQLPQSSRHPAFIGTCVQNLLGTEFVLRDYHIVDPFKKQVRGRIHELGLVRYETNVLGRVPNTIHATLPRYDPVSSFKGQKETLRNRLAKLSQRRRAKDKTIIDTIRGNNEKDYQAVELDEMEDLLTFETKKPSWNEELGAWTLNFNGRVKLASKKNFLLSPEASNEAMDDEFGSDTVCLRFGKVLKDRFSLDYRHPIAPVQALFISMTAFATKRAVT